jgi:hypothetical protein
MTPSLYRPLAALLLIGGIFAYIGCSNSIDAEPKNEPPPLAVPSSAKSEAAGGKLFADWPTPAGALVISGEQDGYLEPCGCTSGQLGGLLRRYDLVERMREQQKWPVALIDLGSLIKDPAKTRGGPAQERLKFDIALKALKLMKYDAFALSAEDLKIGVDEALGQFLNLGESPKILVANVTASSGFEKTIQRSMKTSVGAVKVGITAVIDPEALNKLSDSGKDDLLPKVIAPEKALPEVLAELEKDTHTQILMVQGPPEMARKLAEEFPGFDIVVATSQFDPSEEAERLNGGKTLLISIGTKGKYVGVVGFFLDPKQKYRYQRITLSDRYNGKAEPMKKLIEDDFQEMLKQQGVVENYPRRSYTGEPDATFVGADACKSCHPGSYDKWTGSKHFQAFDDIVTDPEGKRSDHQFDAECVSCHTTGFEYKSGWVSNEKTEYLAGNQCENCHGPASKHVADPDNVAFRRSIARTLTVADKGGMCIRCHDEDNSPNYNFEKYWKEIDHKGLDKYDDPKVHQKSAPKASAGASK